MKKQAVPAVGVLQYFLDKMVQISTDVEQSREEEDGSIQYAKLAYQGILLDFDDTWVVLGYYDESDMPNIIASIKINNVIAVSLDISDNTPINTGSSEVN